MAIEIIPDRICKDCGGNIWLISKNGKYKQYKCYKSHRDYQDYYKECFPDKYKESHKRAHEKRVANGYYTSPERINYKKKEAENLTDSYIRSALKATSMWNKNLSDDEKQRLIEVKRQILIVKRTIRKEENERNLQKVL
jgi:hypothetical protein